MTVYATSTIAGSFGLAAASFASQAVAAAKDATALKQVIYGLDDGNDYGRYFFGQDPLITYADAASSLAGLIAQGVEQLQTVIVAADALVVAGSTAITGFGTAADALTEALRQACANPGDAVRLLSGLAGFQLVRTGRGVPQDALGAELFVLAGRAVLRLRLAAVQSLVRATADYQPTSRQDAAGVRDQVCGILDALAMLFANLFDDATASALFSARVAVYADLEARGAALVNVTTLEVNKAVPARVIAYMLYGDATRGDEVLARNQLVPHPGFLPQVLEVATQ